VRVRGVKPTFIPPTPDRGLVRNALSIHSPMMAAYLGGVVQWRLGDSYHPVIVTPHVSYTTMWYYIYYFIILNMFIYYI